DGGLPISTTSWAARLMLVAAHDGQEFLEVFTAQFEGAHIRTNEILAKIFIHLDDNWSRQSWLCHYKMITLDARFDAPRELTDIAQFLPRDLLHAVAPRRAGASYPGIVRRTGNASPNTPLR